MSLVFHPPIPFALSLFLGLAVLGACFWLGRGASRFWPSFAIRCAAVGLALFALAGPSKETPKVRAGGKPKLTVVVDTSASMAEEWRWAHAWQAALNVQTAYGPLAEVSVLDLDGHPLAVVTKADAPQSDLVGAVRAARGADAVLLISDGRATLLPAGDWPAALKADLGGAPVYALPVGEAKPGTAPLRLDAWADAEVAYPRQEVGFSVQVTGRPGQRVTLDLRAGTEVLGSPRSVVIPACGVVPVDFAWPVPVGAQGEWRIRVSAQSEEGAAVVAEVPVQIAPGPARVLLLEGAPCIHTREIARALEDDPCAALVAVYDLGPRRLIVRSGEPVVAQAIPQAIDDQTLAAFDVVILGARPEVFFPDASSLEPLAQFAKRGGILFARGDGLAAGSPRLFAGTHEVVQEAPVCLGETNPARWRQTVAKLANHGQAMAAEKRLKKAKPAAEASMAREMADTRPNPALLETLCQATGGRLLAGDDFAPLTQELVRLQPLDGGESEFEPAFNRLWLLAAFIGLLAADFALRRRRGQA